MARLHSIQPRSSLSRNDDLEVRLLLFSCGCHIVKSILKYGVIQAGTAAADIIAKKSNNYLRSGRKQVHSKIKSSAPYEPCHWSKARCTCFWPDKAQVHPSLSTLLDFQLFFVVF